MLLEIHILQNFAPSNLNRDDTGSPKTCEFGGYRRARISSQAIKRAIRNEFRLNNLVPEDQRAIRSKRFVEEITKRLVARGKDPEEAAAVVNAVIEAIGLKTSSDKNAAYTGEFGVGSSKSEVTFRKLQVLLYLSAAELNAFAEFADKHWEALLATARAETASTRDKKATRGAPSTALSKKVIDEFKAQLDGGRAVDLALFGRMLAHIPDRDIDAASQVAPAISTNRVSVEFDYFTAGDDLKPGDTEGADMIGTVEFNSACYYRYANIHLGQLKQNLGGDDALVEAAVRAFLVASRDAIPTGKQNSFAARNAPSFIMTVVRPSGAWSLANAFVRPIHPDINSDLVSKSIQALGTYWGDLAQLYGTPKGFHGYIAVGQQGETPGLGAPSPDFSALLAGTLAAVREA